MPAQAPPTPPSSSEIRFKDLPLAALFIYRGHELSVEPPAQPSGLVSFTAARSTETEQLLQGFATDSLTVEPRRFYDALGIAKRLVHRAKERAR